MTIFEFLMVLVSVILALGLAQLLTGAGQRVVLGGQIRPWWVHSVWLVILGLVHVQLWWGLWFRFNAPDFGFSFLHFAYLLTGPAILFLSVYILLPGSHPDDAEAHFFRVRRPFYFLSLVTALWAMAGPFIYERAVPIGFRVIQAALVALALLGLASSKRQVHSAIAPVYLGLLVVFFVIQAHTLEQP